MAEKETSNLSTILEADEAPSVVIQPTEAPKAEFRLNNEDVSLELEEFLLKTPVETDSPAEGQALEIQSPVPMELEPDEQDLIIVEVKEEQVTILPVLPSPPRPKCAPTFPRLAPFVPPPPKQAEVNQEQLNLTAVTASKKPTPMPVAIEPPARTTSPATSQQHRRSRTVSERSTSPEDMDTQPPRKKSNSPAPPAPMSQAPDGWTTNAKPPAAKPLNHPLMLGERKTTGYVVKNWTGYDRRVPKQNTNHLERYSQWISAVKKRPADYTEDDLVSTYQKLRARKTDGEEVLPLQEWRETPNIIKLFWVVKLASKRNLPGTYKDIVRRERVRFPDEAFQKPLQCQPAVSSSSSASSWGRPLTQAPPQQTAPEWKSQTASKPTSSSDGWGRRPTSSPPVRLEVTENTPPARTPSQMFRDNSGWEDPKGAQPWEPKPAQRKPERGEFKKQLKAKQALRSQEQQQRRYDESFAPPASRPETKRIHGRPAAFPYEQRVESFATDRQWPNYLYTEGKPHFYWSESEAARQHSAFAMRTVDPDLLAATGLAYWKLSDDFKSRAVRETYLHTIGIRQLVPPEVFNDEVTAFVASASDPEAFLNAALEAAMHPQALARNIDQLLDFVPSKRDQAGEKIFPARMIHVVLTNLAALHMSSDHDVLDVHLVALSDQIIALAAQRKWYGPSYRSARNNYEPTAFPAFGTKLHKEMCFK
ncbi:unnamed protein product [Oikopleura dioica]|uniref:Uncharacterized protein n=1 Tax=Oikopleura dioica TaxID=34765 RepID=E4YQV2_OIKDI|nr:unnamed protein product [Oikopleura dioica]